MSLTRCLLEQHDALRVLANGLAAQSAWPAEAKVIREVALVLTLGPAPDAAEATALWSRLEGALATVAGEPDSGGGPGRGHPEDPGGEQREGTSDGHREGFWRNPRRE